MAVSFVFSNGTSTEWAWDVNNAGNAQVASGTTLGGENSEMVTLSGDQSQQYTAQFWPAYSGYNLHSPRFWGNTDIIFNAAATPL